MGGREHGRTDPFLCTACCLLLEIDKSGMSLYFIGESPLCARARHVIHATTEPLIHVANNSVFCHPSPLKRGI